MRLADKLRNIPDFPKPGIQFKDITPLLLDAEAFQHTIDLLVKPFESMGVTHIVAIEARGFIFGSVVASRLNAGFVPIRKPGKLPAKVDSVSYALEYGENELQMHKDSLTPDSRVVVIDDVLATAGTAVAAADLVRLQGGRLLGFGFVCELDFLSGRDRLLRACPMTTVHSLIHF